MQFSGRTVAPSRHARIKHIAPKRSSCMGPWRVGGVGPVAVKKGFGMQALGNSRPATVKKDMTAELLDRAFMLALTTRLKQHGGIHVDVQSTAWGLMEGRFGGLTVRGYKWRTPLELTADQLMVDVGELVLDYQKLMWQQTVALKNVPQGSVAFTLTSTDLGNFMAHPIMVAAAARAVKGHPFLFDRSTASVSLDPATGRGVITYQGTWAGDGQRYAVTMITPPPAAAAAAAARAAAAAKAAGVAAMVASSNTLEQLTVSARRVAQTGAARSTTGSFASVGSADEPLAAAPVAAAAAAAMAAAAAGARAGTTSSGGRVQTLTMAPAAAAVAAAGAVSMDASYGSDGEAGLDSDPGAEVVAEGLRRFFSGLVINLQGIELRNPVLLVQLPGPGIGAAAGAGPGLPRAGAAPQPPRPVPAPAAASSGPAAVDARSESLVPALLTITMKVAILQLPPLNMKF